MPADLRPSSTYALNARPVLPARGQELPTALYEISWLDDVGRECWDSVRLEASPIAESAVASFARGTHVATPRGDVAIEDLIPGDRVNTPSGSASIRWIGTRVHAGAGPRPTLYRVKGNTFGRGKPEDDVVLGAGAQVLVDNPRCRGLVGGDQAFAPIAAFEDAMNVIAVQPPGDVVTYGLACEGQESILIGGMAVETYHPARDMMRRVTPSVLQDMATLIPPINGGFGSARVPYLSITEAQTLQLL